MYRAGNIVTAIGLFQVRLMAIAFHLAAAAAAPTGLALQPLNAFLRPHPPGPNAVKPLARTLWELLHKNLGRAVIILAIVEIFMGLDRLGGTYLDGLPAPS